MRFRSFVLFVFWVCVLGYGGYVGVAAGSTYFQTRELVEQAFSETTKRLRTPGAGEAAGQEYASDTRAGILIGARRAGIPLEPRNLVVAPEGDVLRVSFHWSYPLITYGGETILAIPLWLDRSFDLRAPARG
jgi:hypothetical protein